jgi:hypothetical protein
MDFDRLCKDILGLESRKRFAGVCDDSGEIKYGGQREEKAVSKSILVPHSYLFNATSH